MPKVQDDPNVPVEQITDLDAYKARVFAVARAEAVDRGWCEVIDEILTEQLGLAEFYPSQLVIESRANTGGDWSDYATYNSAEAEVEYLVRQATRYWRNSKDYNSAPTRPHDLCFYVDGKMDLEAAMRRLKKENDSIGKTPTPESIFPQYRVVERNRGAAEPTSVLWDCLEYEREQAQEAEKAEAATF